MSVLTVEKVHVESRPFARHHRLRLPRAGSRLALGPARGEGAFGAVHEARLEDGSPAGRELLAKRIDLTRVRRPDLMIENVSALLRALDRCVEPGWQDSVLALPFSVAAATVEGQAALIMFMLDLKALGYQPAPPSDAPEGFRGWDRYRRIEIAFNFARRARLFEELSFLHGDLNPENTMINPSTLDVQVFDFDAGVVVDSGSERPLSANKPGPFIPPEIKQAGASLVDTGSFTLAAERWSVGIMVGTILFGASPATFIRELSAGAIDAYARQERSWPDIDPESEIFNPMDPTVFANFTRLFEAAPGEARATFAEFFAAGSDGTARPRAGEWVKALAVARQAPSFEFVAVDRELVLEGTEFELTWVSQGAEWVKGAGLGDLELSGAKRVRLEQSRDFTLVAGNVFGETKMSSPRVRVVPLPRITSIPLPAFPALSLRARLSAPIPPVPPLQLTPPSLARVVPVPPALPLSKAAPLPGSRSVPPAPRFSGALAGGVPRMGVHFEGSHP